MTVSGQTPFTPPLRQSEAELCIIRRNSDSLLSSRCEEESSLKRLRSFRLEADLTWTIKITHFNYTKILQIEKIYMELPQPRPLGTQGRKATHDFLALYSSPPAHAQQDPITPQERVVKNSTTTKEENKAVITGVERPPVPSPPASVEHLLPGGIGTYSISYFNQRVLKPEASLFTAQASNTTINDENSNCSSYTGSGFTLWDESAVKKGKTGKENISAERQILREAGVNVVGGQWTSLLEKPSQSSSNHKHNITTFSSFSSSQFQKLREIIPNSDQKRDKASFLLEVIDYIQFLQEKVNRYEGPYNVWNHEPSKMMQWKNSHIAEGFLDHAQGVNADAVFARKSEENKAGVSPSLPINGKNLVDSDISTATTFKERGQQPELTSKVHPPMQPNIFTFGRTSIAASPVSPKQPSDTDKTTTWPPSTPDCTASGNKTKDQELSIESGTINISSVYSQGLLNTLTQALQSSGVDLSQASISVQIDLGKRANCVQHASTLPTKDDDVPGRSRAASAGEEFGHALKRLRTS
ncbi:hypothetical protein DH2020_013128 [Rehmannia glutinosa]|uniref:BHLH domain-containing protein n=1 Tax=Rehmannia glutinosa TaxID=99300 RepID=A0ABR0X242_REHGL